MRSIMDDQLSDLPIYHLTPAVDYLRLPKDQPYTPASFAEEGFIHCSSGQVTLLEVANRYFASLNGPLLALEIEPTRLTAPLKFEPPITPPGHQPPENSRSNTLIPPVLFPHIYGPIDRAAIISSFLLVRNHNGQWTIDPAKGFSNEQYPCHDDGSPFTRPARSAR